MIVGLERPTGGTIVACGHDRSPAGPRRPATGDAAGREVQIVFQDPYSSLDPRQTAEQTLIDEVLRLHHDWPADAAPGPGDASWPTWSASTAARRGRCPAPCPAGSGSGSRSPGPWPPSRAC